MSSVSASYNPNAFVFRLPLIGAMLKDAVFGHADAKYYFAFNLIVLLFWSFFHFGYPAIIIYGLTGTFSAMVLLVVLTSQDIIENIGKPRPMPRLGQHKVYPR
jgi:hypothetical protein